jgi:hypothetical protein
LMIAAAALISAAGMASAQSMEANVPFAFRVGNKVMAAGTYRVEVAHGTAGQTVLVRSAQKQNAFVIAYPDGDVKASWQNDGLARLTFTCGVSRCALTNVWTATGPLYRVPASKLGKDEPVHTAEIVMHAVKGD